MTETYDGMKMWSPIASGWAHRIHPGWKIRWQNNPPAWYIENPEGEIVRRGHMSEEEAAAIAEAYIVDRGLPTPPDLSLKEALIVLLDTIETRAFYLASAPVTGEDQSWGDEELIDNRTMSDLTGAIEDVISLWVGGTSEGLRALLDIYYR